MIFNTAQIKKHHPLKCFMLHHQAPLKHIQHNGALICVYDSTPAIKEIEDLIELHQEDHLRKNIPLWKSHLEILKGLE